MPEREVVQKTVLPATVCTLHWPIETLTTHARTGLPKKTGYDHIVK